RRPADTRVVLSQVMQPPDANFMGVIHGGVMLKLIDETAGACAHRFTRTRVVTAAIDRIDFHHPVQIGNLVTLQATINHVGRTSMEVGVRIEAEDLDTGTITHTNSAYLVFVALDDQGNPTPAPRLTPETAEDKRRWAAAEARRAARQRLREPGE
ncbi:MAG TPA: acyl-CoA thioesterase, partial [Thermoleophilia bacterium]|nr:acyl-CoA thioesterase [Thermoleophilia bacterium]